MAHDDFDIDSLAAYLHLTPDKVKKMADRGKIPARKVGGDWKFSRAEVHHWLEERIGALDDEGLERLEANLDRAGAGEETYGYSIAELMPLEAFAVPLPARTRNSVIKKMVELAAGTGMLWDPAKMVEAVRAREDMHPTAMEGGFALLHPRRPMATILAEPIVAFGRTDAGIPFGGGGGGLTDLFFLICSTDDQGHLRTLARLTRMLGDHECLDELREAADGIAAREVLISRDEELTG